LKSGLPNLKGLGELTLRNQEIDMPKGLLSVFLISKRGLSPPGLSDRFLVSAYKGGEVL
jgi:hypothetical protein